MDDKLHVGGDFKVAGGTTPAVRIASWDGERWRPLEEGLNHSVTVLETGGDGDVLYVGGRFSVAGAERSPRVARWVELDCSADDPTLP